MMFTRVILNNKAVVTYIDRGYGVPLEIYFWFPMLDIELLHFKVTSPNVEKY